MNAAAVVFAAAAILYYCYTEYTLHGLSKEIAGWQQQIDRDAKPSREIVAKYKKFKDEEARATELVKFRASEKLVLSDFIIAIGKSLPDNLVITGITYRDVDVVLRGTVKGAPELASGAASGYEKKLRDTTEIASSFDSISLSTLSRDATSGLMTFEMVFKFKK
ncbi:MAG TPA: hypothetical protein VFT72_03265 [Opitutaceae bacterium]|nr:hypothetical protein [Opitutaceae bacterium]